MGSDLPASQGSTRSSRRRGMARRVRQTMSRCCRVHRRASSSGSTSASSRAMCPAHAPGRASALPLARTWHRAGSCNMLQAPVWLPALCALEPTGLHSQSQNSCPNGALPSRGKCAGQARAPHQGMPSEVSTARALRTCDGRPCSISGRAQIPDQSLHLPGTPPALRPALSLKGPSAHLPGPDQSAPQSAGRHPTHPCSDDQP